MVIPQLICFTVYMEVFCALITPLHPYPTASPHIPTGGPMCVCGDILFHDVSPSICLAVHLILVSASYSRRQTLPCWWLSNKLCLLTLLVIQVGEG